MSKYGIKSTFTVAMVTKMATKIGENRKLPIFSKFETFDRGINIEHKQIPKVILTDERDYQSTQHIKRIFGI